MPGHVPPFKLHFEIIFLESYSGLQPSERKAIDKAIKFLSVNPKHPSLNIHKAKNVKGKYAEGRNDVFLAYASKNLRLTFEYGSALGTIALRNCGHHESCEREI